MQSSTSPWYKEPWPWVLIAIILIPMLVAAVRLSIYNDYKVEMVVDDYYKKGKSINQEFAREKLAKTYNLSALVNFTEHNIVLDLNHNEQAPEIASLIISFYHSTQGFKDFNLMATARADGKFTAVLPEKDLSGKWQLTLEPHDKRWKIQKNIHLPDANQIIITP
ncbi:FixH family protein [Catenovulum sp. 2E275]|uniref:FixH family protein n=1 Tax=Catenovulum sp. 2E275 TaxID=2980497 RepID=UPI0021D21F37|nr:FixH family protein [Catenovulum sp. 2E275]MCU4674530.1 FixH family protein [Catenovulum sp. 2E275]